MKQAPGVEHAVEREKIAERSTRGKAERARNCKLAQGTGAGRYGYIYEPETGQRVLNPRQAAVVRRIFEEWVSGKAVNRITTDLNIDGIPTLTGKQWYPVTVRRILRNETYTGRTVYRRTRVEMVRQSGARRRKRCVVEQDPSEHIVIEGASPQIISPESYALAQSRFEDPERRSARAPSRTYPLRGRLRCRDCGAGMVGQPVQHGRYFYYRCNRLYLSNAEKRCSGRQVRKETLEDAVRSTLEDVRNSPSAWPSSCARGRITPPGWTKLARELSHIDDSQDRLVDLCTDGEVTKDASQQKRERLTRRRASLEREQAQLRSECEPGPDPEMLREVLAFVREWVTKAEGDDLELLLSGAERARGRLSRGGRCARRGPDDGGARGGRFCHHCTNIGMKLRSCEKGCARLYLALSF